jgi:hypothetical protein
MLKSWRWILDRLATDDVLSQKQTFETVLQIHGILVWIRLRIWIRGSTPLIMDPDPDLDPDADPDPAIFLIDLQDANKKLICLFTSFLLITF